MLVDLATKSECRADIDPKRIEEKVHAEFTRKLGKPVGEAELERERRVIEGKRNGGDI